MYYNEIQNGLSAAGLYPHTADIYRPVVSTVSNRQVRTYPEEPTIADVDIRVHNPNPTGKTTSDTQIGLSTVRTITGTVSSSVDIARMDLIVIRSIGWTAVDDGERYIADSVNRRQEHVEVTMTTAGAQAPCRP